FSLEERMEMISETLRAIQGVTVVPMRSGLIADFAREHGAQALVKGVRNSGDLSYEMPMATFNRHLSGVETVFLPADARYQHVSSTLIKEIVGFKDDISEFIPYAMAQRVGLKKHKIDNREKRLDPVDFAPSEAQQAQQHSHDTDGREHQHGSPSDLFNRVLGQVMKHVEFH